MEKQIHVVDDDASFRDSMRALLESAGYRVAVYASVGTFLSDDADEGGCLIADVHMPDMGGLELQEELTRQGIAMPVIIITGRGDVPCAVRAMKAGAIDFIEKPFDDQVVLESVGRALELGRKARDHQAEVKAARDLLDLLTPRERAVLDQLCKGHSNKVAAHELGISARTIEIHRGRLMRKMRVRSMSHLIRTTLLAQS
jgi:two-component system response regulator FixJ